LAKGDFTQSHSALYQRRLSVEPGFMRRFLPIALLLTLAACGSSGPTNTTGADPSLTRRVTANAADEEPQALYALGMQNLRARNYARAVEYFDSIEREHPYSTWSTSAKLMAAYTEYLRNRYTEAIGALDRFIQLHPAHRDIAYAYYLRALSQYEQITDAQRDQRQTTIAIAALQEVINRFPDSAYARDARLKIDLGRDHLAGKEMTVGRFYQRQGLHQAAIGRYRRVVEDFQTTNHVPEALHRLVEIYLNLGLTEEARRNAAVLGYNYPGSDWYADSYALLVAAGAEQRGERPGFVSRMLNRIF
jgi:outer membrane protein assembly factor BamD